MAFGLGIIFLYIALFLVPKSSSKEPDPKWAVYLKEINSIFPVTEYLLKYLIAVLLGYTFGGYFIWKAEEKLLALYPSIELNIGPEHKFVEKKRRNIMLQYVILGGIPIITSFLYDIIKAIFIK